MKKNKGITLIALVITIIVLLILAGVTIATLTGDNGLLQKSTSAKKENAKAKELELIKLAVSAAQVAGEGTITADNLNNELKNNFNDDNEVNIYDDFFIYTTDSTYKIYVDGTVLKPTNELYFTKAFLQKGEVNISDGTSINFTNFTVDEIEYPGISITGRPNKLPNVTLPSDEIRWYKNIDLTNYSTLEFFVKKGSTHGSMKIRIDDNDVLLVRYGNLSEEWTKYTVDMTQYSGIHTLNIVGGYFDASGNPGANTKYCNIILK